MKCPHCKQPLDKNTALCPFCGKPPAIPKDKKSMRQLSAFCGNCHQRVQVGIDPCPYCGIALNWDAVDASPSFAPTQPEPTQPEPTQPEPSEPVIGEDEKACAKCGRPISIKAVHCWRCGAIQSAQGTVGNAPAPQESEPLFDEHSAFGPWVYQIGANHIVPPLFAQYANTLAGALMAFKIPRHIDRRKARYYKDLYDAVVGIYEDYVLILRRSGTSVGETRVDIRQVQAISNTLCLLKGELRLYTDTMVFLIVYNTVSEDVIRNATSLIHSLQHAETKPLGLTPLSHDSESIGILFHNLVTKIEKTDQDAQLVAFQPPSINVTRSLAVVINGRELTLIDREKKRRKLFGSGPLQYTYTYVYIPLTLIAGVYERAVSDKNTAAKSFVIETSHHTFSWQIDESSTGISELIARLSRT